MTSNASWKRYVGIVATLLLNASLGGATPQAAAKDTGKEMVRDIRTENPFPERFLAQQTPELEEAVKLNQQVEQLYQQGKYAEAILLAERALAILEKTLGSEHPHVATSLNNLAALYRAMGNYAAAEPLHQRALAIFERAFGSEHPDVATSLNNLALLYQDMGNYAAAEPLHQRSLAIRERAFGSEHPDVATSLNNLAALYRAMGNYAAAEPLHQRALAISEKDLGSEHPLVATSLNNLAALYQVQNNLPRATEFLQRGTNIEEKNLSLIFTTGSETEKRAYVKTLSGTTNRTISLNLQAVPHNPETTRLALTTILRRKGRILDALSESLDLLRQNLTPENQALIDKLTDTRRQLAALIYQKPENLSLEQYRQQVAALKTESDQLEAELSRRSAEFRVASAPVTIAAVQQLIPNDAALIEIVSYQPFNPKAEPSEQWGEPRYAAYILQSTGEPQALDLGEAEVIDAAIVKFRQGFTDILRPSLVKVTGRELDVLVMQPIRAKLGNTKNWLISPDGPLNLIPFAALSDENNRYLVENYRITYLTTGRDLLRLSLNSPPQQPPVIVANPNYDTVDRAAIASLNSASNSNNRRSADLDSLRFDALPATKAEAEAIAPLLDRPTLFLGAEATENAVKQVRSPSILHLATHGFFLKIDPVTPSDENASQTAQQTESPLLRSGLAFAGINIRRSGDEDGVLTALEAAQLNLRGTQLVVLSACQTGLGEIVNS